MQSSVTPVQWWVQLIDSSPLENHDDIRGECCWFTGAEHCLLLWDKNDPTPTAIVAQGNGPPPNVYAFLEGIQHLIGRNEYMVFVIMVESHTLHRAGLYHIVVTHNAIARVETGQELLAKAKATVLDADEELAAGG